MLTSELTRLIVMNLASLWCTAKLPVFQEYVRQMHGLDVVDSPRFRCIYIGQTEEGNPRRAPMPGLIKQWWQVDDEGVREVKIPKVDGGTEDSLFFLTAVILFYFEGDLIAVAERLGQGMACWKSGHISFEEGTVQLYLKLLPNS